MHKAHLKCQGSQESGCSSVVESIQISKHEALDSILALLHTKVKGPK